MEIWNIRFRVYDKPSHRSHDVISLEFSYETIRPVLRRVVVKVVFNERERWENFGHEYCIRVYDDFKMIRLMQYVGADKNGKDQYKTIYNEE